MGRKASVALGYSGVLLAICAGCSVDGEGTGFDNGEGAAATGSDGGGEGGGGGGETIIGGGGSSGSGTGGSAGGAFDGCESISETATNTLQPADIIFAIDSSGSMGTEMAAVQANMNAFSQQIAASGIDTRIVLIAEPPASFPIPFVPPEGICIEPPLGAGNCPANETNPSAGYWHLLDAVGSTNALNVIMTTYPKWQNVMRSGATKAFVVVTDDDDRRAAPYATPDAWIQAVDALPEFTAGAWKFHGIYCFTDCLLVAADVGTAYQELVGKTGGVAGDLCLQNFTPVFDAIAAGVIEGAELKCEWDIPAAPAGQAFDPGKLNVDFTDSAGATTPILHVPDVSVCGPQGGWYYDNPQNPTKVLVCPATCDAIRSDKQGRIDVLFGCETIDIPK